jgi:hypothetical protein
MMATAVSWSGTTICRLSGGPATRDGGVGNDRPNGGDGFDLIPGGAGRQEFNQFVCGGLFVPGVGFAYTLC